MLFDKYSGQGGAKSVHFVRNFQAVYFSGFSATIAIMICKVISMIRRIDWRALQGSTRGCTRGNFTSAQLIFENMQKSQYHGVYASVRSARKCARKLLMHTI